MKISAINYFACPFLMLNPSTSEAAMGKVAGIADISDFSPSGFSNNPAKLGAFNSIGYEYSILNHYSTKFTASTVAISKNGIGISFPVINSDGIFGDRIVYNEFEYNSIEEDIIKSYEPKEYNTNISIGIDVQEVLKKIHLIKNTSDYCRIFTGASLNLVINKLLPKEYIPFYYNDRIACYLNYGIIAEKTFTVCKTKNPLSISAGLVLVNPTHSTIKYINTEENLPYEVNYGFSVNYSKIIEEKIILNQVINSLYSINFQYGLSDYAQSRKDYSHGVRLSFFDLLSYRISISDIDDNPKQVLSQSVGLNIDLTKQIHFNVDYTNTDYKNEQSTVSQAGLILVYDFK
jgi:hypothetical protein